jgi:hypothetical protein
MLDQTGCKFPNRTFLPTWTCKITIKCYKVRDVRLWVLTAVTKRIAVPWDMTPYSLAQMYRHSGGSCCLHLQGRSGGVPKSCTLKMAAASFSTPTSNFYQTVLFNM